MFLVKEIREVDREKYFPRVDPCSNSCSKVHQVAVLVYPDPGQEICGIHPTIPHGALQIDIYTFYKWCRNGRVIQEYDMQLQKANQGGAPFFAVQLNVTHEEYSHLVQLINSFNDPETTCVGSVNKVLSKAGIVNIPFPASQLPIISLLFLRCYKFLGLNNKISEITIVGGRKPRKCRSACMAVAEIGYGAYLVAEKVVSKIRSFFF